MKHNKISAPKQEAIEGKIYYTVRFPEAGGRKRRRFADKDEARNFYERKRIELAKFGSAESLSDGQRADAARAAEILAPYGISLLDAAKQIADMEKKKRGGRPLRDAIADFISSKKNAKLSHTHITNMQTRLYEFESQHEGCTTQSIDTATIDAFLEGLENLAPITVVGYRRAIHTFFEWAEARGLCDKNPVSRAFIPKIEKDEVGILTVSQANDLMRNCPSEITAAVAIQLFCGLRAAEASKIQWDAVKNLDGVIQVDSKIAKTNSRRTVPIPDNARAWLAQEDNREGRVMPPNYRNLFDMAKVKTGFKPTFTERQHEGLQAALSEAKATKRTLAPWVKNGLRHSAISYALAKDGDITKAATAAGNSPSIIRSHYLELVMPRDAAAFFSIYPDGAEPAN